MPEASLQLSELARQLRLLQSANQCLESEKQGLQRQINILSDLSGVSVQNLSASLQEACQNQADAELQTRVALLESQLEQERLKHSSTNEPRLQNQAYYELRVGELEECAESDKREMADLYEAIQESNSKACRLQLLCEEQDATLTMLRERLKRTGDHCTDIVVTPKTPKTAAYSYGGVDIVQILKNQVQQRENELSLKEDQYRARFTYQESRISDLEQQLSSLYAACGMVEQERSQEQSSRERLAQDLTLADEQVAMSMAGGESANTSSTAAISTSSASDQSPPRVNRSAPGSPRSANLVLSGTVKVKSRMGSWKYQYATLTQEFSCFVLQLSADAGQPQSQTFEIVGFRSQVEQVSDRTLRIRLGDKSVLTLSLDDDEAFANWHSALVGATTGTFRSNDDDDDLEAAIAASLRECNVAT